VGLHETNVGSPIFLSYSTVYFRVVRWTGLESAVGAGSSLPASMIAPREFRSISASIFFWTSETKVSLVDWAFRALRKWVRMYTGKRQVHCVVDLENVVSGPSWTMSAGERFGLFCWIEFTRDLAEGRGHERSEVREDAVRDLVFDWVRHLSILDFRFGILDFPMRSFLTPMHRDSEAADCLDERGWTAFVAGDILTAGNEASFDSGRCCVASACDCSGFSAVRVGDRVRTRIFRDGI
jgi:hypothetical protein